MVTFAVPGVAFYPTDYFRSRLGQRHTQPHPVQETDPRAALTVVADDSS